MPKLEWMERLATCKLAKKPKDLSLTQAEFELLRVDIAAALAALAAKDAEITRLNDIIKHAFESDQWSDCPECGFGVNVDEDGCCISCGRDAMQYTQAVHDLRGANAEIDQLMSDNHKLMDAMDKYEQRYTEDERSNVVAEIRAMTPNEVADEMNLLQNAVDMHAAINADVAAALGEPVEGQRQSWHDLGKKVARLKQREGELRAMNRNTMDRTRDIQRTIDDLLAATSGLSGFVTDIEARNKILDARDAAHQAIKEKN